MYQHDTELTEKFARENPGVITSAREKLVIRFEVDRYVCPRCKYKVSIDRQSYAARIIAETGQLVCGACEVDMVLVNSNYRGREAAA